MNNIFYVTNDRDSVLDKEKFTRALELGSDYIYDFFNAEMPYEVDRFNCCDRDFDPLLLKNEYFDIKEVGGVYEMTLKDDAIQKVLALYSKTLRDYADYIDKNGTRSYINAKASESRVKFNDLFKPFEENKFIAFGLAKDVLYYGDAIDVDSVNSIYELVDFAINQNIKKWYLMPVVGYYR